MSARSKGTAHENNLVKYLTKHGHSAYRVPMSGALGESDKVKLPPELKDALTGDVCLRLQRANGIKYIPFEVKYRSDGTGFKHLLKQIKENKTVFYRDCVVTTTLDFLTDRMRGIELPDNALNKTLDGWYDKAQVLVVKAKLSPWIFIVRRRDE